ncbi:holo-ACP synthase [Alicyclobacillus cycloheptanicus]|uniref:Holo-[acyl-carrier-protein] synthase n=1 Tax=Alicyclobacillus cycloheptanicus TaxID=1457 RepID=A0ABT9XID3_9BACL|nr:holo-ACP synthase [Alicyclobacillus cycloheptanicus]MDQ0190075.1 holo-[acyl-carrier protein] synthase [Alicyclobacillus cycloheptanicus]WDM02053.1 holo-ACP synthase [Alicyclobacillus cycloheptanicus]
MIRGIGTDIVEISRVQAAARRHGAKLEARILSESEQRLAAALPDPRRIEFLAGRFAAKEAIGKAIGRGIGHLRMRSVSIEADAAGKPVVHWRDEDDARPFAEGRWHVSISHSDTTAFAVAIWEDG